LIDGESILEMEPDERTKAGLFLAFQYPVAVPGVSVANFLRTAVSNVRGYTAQQLEAAGRSGMIGSNLMPMREFRKELNEKMKEYNVDSEFCPPLSQRRLLRRREEAHRSAADGNA
jgi:Fe-S cluster assembly ATP-binding protein